MDQAEAHDDPLLGQSIGNYVVKAKLGEGGMGAVYMAEHPAIGKRVALKVLHPELSSKDDVVHRFFNEAKAVNEIQHPNIVDVIDYGVVEGEARGGSMVYFIMEFLGGRSLTYVLENEAPLPADRALRIAVQIADALAASHKNNIVHRDLKPDNIMLVEKRHEHDFVKVLDFGIAKLTGEGHQSSKTRTGIVMGTPAYMSPEQCEGRGQIDHRTDIYALAVVIYQMLTGRVPFEGEGYGEVLVQHLTQPPPPPSSLVPAIPPHLEMVILKALTKKKEQRFPTMEEFLRALMDPVGYVEAHGGLSAFLGASIADSGAPLPHLHGRPGSVLTPPPGMYTPAPGQMYTPAPGQMYTPAPGQMVTPGPMHTPAPGHLQAPAGPSGAWQAPPKKSRGIVIAAAAVIVIGAGVGAIIALSGGDEQTEALAQADAAAAAVAVPAQAPIDASAAVAKDPEPPTNRVIAIETTPPGADVFLGEQMRGKSPVDVVVPNGDALTTVRVVLDGYESQSRSFTPNQDFPPFKFELVKIEAPAEDKPSSRHSKRPKPTTTKPTTTTTKPTTTTTKTKKPEDSTGVMRPTF